MSKRIYDIIDLKMCHTLEKEPRATISKIAKKVGLTTTPVFLRLKKLHNNKIINYNVSVDYDKLKKCNPAIKEILEKASHSSGLPLKNALIKLRRSHGDSFNDMASRLGISRSGLANGATGTGGSNPLILAERVIDAYNLYDDEAEALRIAARDTAIKPRR